MRRWIAARSFRLKLIGLVLLVQALTLGMLFWQGRALLDSQLREQVQQRIAQINPLLNAALTLPLAQRDYAAVHEIAQQTMTGNTLAYLVVENREGKVVTRIGDAPASGVKTRDFSSRRIDVEQELGLNGERLGKAHYGVPLDFLAAARQKLERQALQTGGLAVLLSLALLAALAHGLFRRVVRVEQAANALAAGDMTQRIAVQGDSEIDHLGRSFNRMADALQSHMTEIHQINADLEARVAARTAELSAARDEAERLARVKSEFLASMSHEIRTPLNGVLGMAQVGRRKCAGDPQACHVFDQILRSGELLLGIINDILDFSKIEAGKLKVEHAPFDLRETLGHALDLVRERAEAKGLTLQLALAHDLPPRCRGDALRLGQVLLNLLGNAVKFTEHGQVALEARRMDDTLVVSVVDSGIGMDAPQVERLFRPFEQAETSTARRFGGTGLGLAISKRLVDLMGGEIAVASQPGVGSRFELRLPLDIPPEAILPEPAAVPAMEERRRLAGLRILVAEDEPINRAVLEELLDEEGAIVVSVENGRAAVARIASERDAFDVVLMDVMMPEMDGCAATREILRMAPELPVIGQTAHAMYDEHDNCRAAGMVDLVTKPIDIDAMVAAIVRHVRPPR